MRHSGNAVRSRPIERHREEQVAVEAVRDLLHIDHQVPRQGGNGGIDEELHRQPLGFKVDADHRPQFRIDEQQKDVLKLGMALFHDIEIVVDRRSDYGGADHKQPQIAEPVQQPIR
jgi:hypothetical protein